jgi:hypothetical protein
MKKCPKCNFNYSDNTLEFCLEDGSRLFSISSTQTDTPTVTNLINPAITSEKTVNLPSFNAPEDLKFQTSKNLQTNNETDSIKNDSSVKNYKILEIASVATALIHNWWQWLYLNNQYYSSFSTYVLSANFLMWLLLLTIGGFLGIYTLKNMQNKTVPIISLVILSINLLLFLVPKH